MAHFDEKDLLKLAKLSRIECSEEEQKKLLHNLKNILAYVEQLKEVDTEGVPPCSHVLETLVNVMREDEVGATLSRDLFLSNAPAHTGGMIRVPPVIKS
jgi:aspartyl-tRNA(Asn)/glutamyl-tRNA(Gln) amidotransferase subunit C